MIPEATILCNQTRPFRVLRVEDFDGVKVKLPIDREPIVVRGMPFHYVCVFDAMTKLYQSHSPEAQHVSLLIGPSGFNVVKRWPKTEAL